MNETNDTISNLNEASDLTHKIDVPEGYVIDQENSTFECIRFKRKICYKDIAEKLFLNKNSWGLSTTKAEPRYGYCSFRESAAEWDNFGSLEQCKKIIALNKLMNVARYLNGNTFKLNFCEGNAFGQRRKYYIALQHFDVTPEPKITVYNTFINNHGGVYFMSEEAAWKAVDILGEETIKEALTEQW